MMTKSEIALLAITVLGTLAVWLAGQKPSLVRPMSFPKIISGRNGGVVQTGLAWR
jgi:hypothetical protein